MTLKNASVGKNLKIEALTGDYCQKLREMGFCEGLDVCKLSDDRCVVCSICNVKYAISKDLSSSVVLNENQYQNPDQSS